MHMCRIKGEKGGGGQGRINLGDKRGEKMMQGGGAERRGRKMKSTKISEK
mgnify:CR=1 FL=1